MVDVRVSDSREYFKNINNRLKGWLTSHTSSKGEGEMSRQKKKKKTAREGGGIC